MSSATLSSSPSVPNSGPDYGSSTIDEQLRLRIAEELASSFKGDVLPFGAGVQRLIDVEFEDGHRYYTKEAHVADLADDAIAKLDAFWRHDMPMEGEVEIIGLGGAIGDVPEGDSAFSNRGYLLWLNFAMRWDDPADDPDYIARTRKIAADLAPWTGQGVYVNMLNFDEQDHVVEAMGGPKKYGELARLKAGYDPQNLFRMNANIPPAQ